MVSKNQTSRGCLTLGRMMMSRFSPAPSTTLITSWTAQRVVWSLTRTERTLLPQSSSFRASIAIWRAPTFFSGETASSRSRKTRSASLCADFSTIRGLLAGTASSERLSRMGVSPSVAFRVCKPELGEDLVAVLVEQGRPVGAPRSSFRCT